MTKKHPTSPLGFLLMFLLFNTRSPEISVEKKSVHLLAVGILETRGSLEGHLDHEITRSVRWKNGGVAVSLVILMDSFF